jgi:hypothetical protein
MVNPIEVEEAFGSFLEASKVMVNELGKEITRLTPLEIKVPDWETAKDPKVLYQCMYEVNSSLDSINKKLAAVQVLRATFKKLEINTKSLEFNRKKIVRSAIREVLDVIADQEKAIILYKEVHDRWARQLNDAQFMQSNARYGKEL